MLFIAAGGPDKSFGVKIWTKCGYGEEGRGLIVSIRNDYGSKGKSKVLKHLIERKQLEILEVIADNVNY